MSFSGSIVIVNFNSGEYLARCLESIAEHAPAANVVVIDNASTDDSAGSAALRRNGVTLQVNPRNVGFGRAVNQGLAAASRHLVMLLNPDCYLLPGAADRLAEELDRHPECAIAGPRILNDDGSVQGSARGDPTLFTGLFGRTTVLTRLFPDSKLARRNVRTDPERVTSGESFAVDWVSGACMMARREALTAVGGFDERYFLLLGGCGPVPPAPQQGALNPLRAVLHDRAFRRGVEPRRENTRHHRVPSERLHVLCDARRQDGGWPWPRMDVAEAALPPEAAWRRRRHERDVGQLFRAASRQS